MRTVNDTINIKKTNLVVELKTLFFGHCCFNIFFVLSIFY